ncbi:MAG: hypothetical protein B7Y25_05100 [Alphaproteobacteria bacterium 16-39-46]|nr:MAG: hypothetical protein B7Y25_05100 [Alphaproteobacteria bacterium 16-39-46]OZA42771.1 MAG: hypothetical protein B7X84_05010 [Alphaproteobacteria bacterium 17-39-52]HQS84305.1 hypothetical protein [Alphaproteobacteria bacterium]HQS94141.1 hypothetical protein [Alphaproteobacteria bacterium]
MSKRSKFLIYWLCFALLQIVSVFAMEEDLSFYGPANRGFSSIYTLPFKKDKQGLQNGYFKIDLNRSIAPGCASFDYEKIYNLATSHGETIRLPASISNGVKLNISTFAIANLTLESYRSLGIEVSPSVKLVPFYEGCKNGERNAFYRRTGRNGGEGEINFCFSQGFTPAKIFDVVSHEAAHAILDALQPRYHKNGGGHPIGAFHEAFGDLSTLFASIRLASFQYQSPSHKNRKIASMIRAEEEVCLAPGLSGNGTCLLRKENSDLCEDHRNSVPFRSFFLRCMNKELERNMALKRSEKKTAEEIVHFFQGLLVHTVQNVPDFESLYDFSYKMIGFVESSPLSMLMRKELKKLRIDLERCKACT